MFATITCPLCAHVVLEEIPESFCQFFYQCRGCGTLLKPKAGYCCVFCSYGDRACPFREQQQTDPQCSHTTPRADSKSIAGRLASYPTNLGSASPQPITPMTQSTPPETTEAVTPNAAATAPASKWPSRGPLE